MNEELFEHYEEREEETRGLAENELEQQMEIDDEEENEDPSRVCWLNLSNDDRRCKILTGFSPEEFLTLYDLVEASIVENIGRGRQSKISKFEPYCLICNSKMASLFQHTTCQKDSILQGNLITGLPIDVNRKIFSLLGEF